MATVEKELTMILAEMDPLYDNDTSFFADANCKGMPSDRFFIEPRTPQQHILIAEAKQVCGLCPVRKRCLEFALNNYIHHGIWGGYTTRQRRGIRRDRRDRV